MEKIYLFTMSESRVFQWYRNWWSLCPLLMGRRPSWNLGWRERSYFFEKWVRYVKVTEEKWKHTAEVNIINTRNTFLQLDITLQSLLLNNDTRVGVGVGERIPNARYPVNKWLAITDNCSRNFRQRETLWWRLDIDICRSHLVDEG